MVFRARGMTASFPDFQRMWTMLEAQDVIGTEARQRYKLDQTSVPLPTGTIDNQLFQHTSILKAYFAFAFDDFYAFVLAIYKLLHEMREQPAIRGRVLSEEMLRTRFTGVSGEVSFEENGDRLGPCELVNFKPQASVAALFSASTSGFSFQGDLIWMDGSECPMPPAQLYVRYPGSNLAQRAECAQEGPVHHLCNVSFANATGMRNCSPCSKGNFAPDVGSVECLACLPGYEAPSEGMEACNRCESGRYMPIAQAERCLPRGRNQIARESGSTAQSACVCEEGCFMCGDSDC
ncbi:Tg [Symbiodinium sp. CCMP2592]|nr:Tg [Symbiodinium sp. CCMP2592]